MAMSSNEKARIQRQFLFSKDQYNKETLNFLTVCKPKAGTLNAWVFQEEDKKKNGNKK